MIQTVDLFLSGLIGVSSRIMLVKIISEIVQLLSISSKVIQVKSYNRNKI